MESKQCLLAGWKFWKPYGVLTTLIELIYSPKIFLTPECLKILKHMLDHRICSECFNASSLELKLGSARYRLLLLVSLTKQIFNFKERIEKHVPCSSHDLMEWWDLVFLLIDREDCVTSPAITSWIDDVLSRDENKSYKSQLNLASHLRTVCLNVDEDGDELYASRLRSGVEETQCLPNCPGRRRKQISIDRLIHNLVSMHKSGPSYTEDFRLVVENQQSFMAGTDSKDIVPSKRRDSSLLILPFQPIKLKVSNSTVGSAINQLHEATLPDLFSNTSTTNQLASTSHDKQPVPARHANSKLNSSYSRQRTHVTRASQISTASNAKKPPSFKLATRSYRNRFAKLRAAKNLKSMSWKLTSSSKRSKSRRSSQRVTAANTTSADSCSSDSDVFLRSRSTSKAPAAVRQMVKDPSKNLVCSTASSRERRRSQRTAAKNLTFEDDCSSDSGACVRDHSRTSEAPAAVSQYASTLSRNLNCSSASSRGAPMSTPRSVRSTTTYTPLGNRFPWQVDDDRKLYTAIKSYRQGGQSIDFDEICKEFDGRSSDSVRNRWAILRKKKSYLHNEIRLPT